MGGCAILASMAEKRTKEDKLWRNIRRLEKDTEQLVIGEKREVRAEEIKAIAASAASDST